MSLGSQTPGDLAARALDIEELFVVEGSQKITSGDCAQLKILQNKGFNRHNVQIFKEKQSAEASTVHTSPFCVKAVVGNTARGASIPAKPEENKPLPGSTTSVATSTPEKRRAGRELASGAECTHSRRKSEILPKVSFADAEYVSTVEQSTAHPKTSSLQDHRDVHNRLGTAGTCRCSSPRTPQNCTVCTLHFCWDSRDHGTPPLCR